MTFFSRFFIFIFIFSLTFIPSVLLGSNQLGEVDPEARPTNPLLEKTVQKFGPPDFEIGYVGGQRVSFILSDPKTFNTLTARDGDSRTIINSLEDSLADYDPYKREFIAQLASFEIVADEEGDTLSVFYTLRDDLYWTTPFSEEKVKVTADDIVFWYDEVAGDNSLQQPGYASQFVDMPDGSEQRITVSKIDERTVEFRFPRIVANPILSSNMVSFGPRYIFEPVKRRDGSAAMLDILSIETDVQNIPSLGPYHLIEYSPGIRVVMRRNPYYWKNDKVENSLPYTEDIIIRIVPDRNTALLLFQGDNLDSYYPDPTQLSVLLEKETRNYTVYDGGASLGASFFTFNQNPTTLDEVTFSWFSQTEFRQAMSSLLNRPRIVRDVYRGLAEPAHYFFARPNQYFNPSIMLEYSYNPQRAIILLRSIGIEQADDGLMYDEGGNQIEFDIMHGVESDISSKMVAIFVEELRSVGINATQRPVDFQSMVERLVSTYDWDAALVSLGVNYWPSSGSNVWQSHGNFHLWYPLQERPATKWEARIDYLYNEGRFTRDSSKAQNIYDEYQNILLTELPVIYTVYPNSFFSIWNRWKNVFYDTLGGIDSLYLFLLKP